MRHLKSSIINFLSYRENPDYKMKVIEDFKLYLIAFFLFFLLYTLYVPIHEALHAIGYLYYGEPFYFTVTKSYFAVIPQAGHFTVANPMVVFCLPFFSSVLGIPFIYSRRFRFLGLWWVGSSIGFSIFHYRLYSHMLTGFYITYPMALGICVFSIMLLPLSFFAMLNNEWVDRKIYEFFKVKSG